MQKNASESRVSGEQFQNNFQFYDWTNNVLKNLLKAQSIPPIDVEKGESKKGRLKVSIGCVIVSLLN
jgi:hypothetical protein